MYENYLNFRKNIQTGFFINYYNNGHKEFSSCYINSAPYGIYSEYRSNGNLIYMLTRKEEDRYGVFIRFNY